MTITNASRELEARELDAVTGAVSAVSDVIKTMGSALNSVARDGAGSATITIFGVELPLPPPK
jgi:hypothetical protein